MTGKASPALSRGQNLRLVLVAMLAIAILGIWTSCAQALNYVYDADGDHWGVEDAAVPGLDTGSIHDTGSRALMGFGGIRMQVDGAPTTPVLNGALLRGFGLTFDGVNSFTSNNSVKLGGVEVTRSLTINQTSNYARFYDTFTNTTNTPIAVDVDFGGQLGYDTGTNQSSIVTTSSGDALPSPADSWVEVATRTSAAGNPSANGPSAIVLGTPTAAAAPFAGALASTGDFLEQPFSKPLQTAGDQANEYGYINHLVLAAGQTKALVHFVVIGLSEVTPVSSGATVPASGSQVTAVANEASSLAAAPEFTGLTAGQLCKVANWSAAAISASVPTWTPGTCAAPVIVNTPAPAGQAAPATTSSPYNVVGKSITQETDDMNSGVTDSQQIVRAYLDRIAAYDEGPLGFHSIVDLNPDAMAQAKADDQARAKGDTRPLLGIPVVIKDIYDTDDLPTTGGSLVFDNFQPETDAFLVARLRAAGAIILGKSNLAEFATDGYFSPSAFGQVWNAFDPSKSSIGSSGGSAVAVALSFAAAALGTQTGDSLWGPSSAASLVSLRGTDGLTSTAGVMPLTYIQDYAGAITRTVQDQALVLNAIAVNNPDDPTQQLEGSGWNGQRPSDWSTYLKPNALRGRVIGYYADAFADPFQDTNTSDAMIAEFKYFEQAGATIKEIPDPPGPPALPRSGDFNYEGWLKWIQQNPNSPYTDPGQIIDNQLRLPLFRASSPTYTGTGPTTDAQNQAFVSYRQAYQTELKDWMSDNGVDAVVFPGELSDIHLNDSIQPSFGRLDPQASNAGVPTVIFPAGENPDGQPDDLQLEGPDYSDPKLLGMAYAFEQVADGYEQSSFAPPLRYDPASIVQPILSPEPVPAPRTTAPGRSSNPDTNAYASSPVTVPSAVGDISAPGKSTAKSLPTVRLLGVTALHEGKFTLKFGCKARKGNCEFVMRMAMKHDLMMRKAVMIAASRTKTVSVDPPVKMRSQLAAHKHPTVVLTLIPANGSAVAKVQTTVRLNAR